VPAFCFLRQARASTPHAQAAVYPAGQRAADWSHATSSSPLPAACGGHRRDPARDGRLDGYAKPLFHDLKIFSWKQDVEQDRKNPLGLAWEALAQGVASIFKNRAKDQFATRVPISGRIDDKQVGTFAAIVGVLRNAFIKAYTPQLEELKPTPAANADGGAK
jgi:hypothetical protein